MVQNRLLLIQSIFRENNLYAFWYLNRIITRELFFRNWSSRHRGVKSASDPKAADNITRLFGTVMPSSIPESTAWWRNQQKELFALSDDSENGLMQTMLTVTLNDSSPELAACIRRGPFAIPDEHEMVEYLLNGKRTIRAPAEKHGVYHVIAYQRRLHQIKAKFFARASDTPSGLLKDWWDRCVYAF